MICSCGPVVSVSQAEESRSHGEAAREAGLTIDALQELDMAMEKEVREQKVSGVIGLIGRKGKVGYYEAFGQRHIQKDEAMSKDSLLRIYSMTKPIVAVTAMSIWEEGKFKLDDPISKYLP
ncbi:MAG: serine hydrolase domain-containing protein, partial [Verrucomicrobiota bacterium]|nr:serine hydrolase domain-containing protein [Verrucomicrobiota bacterium]